MAKKRPNPQTTKITETAAGRPSRAAVIVYSIAALLTLAGLADATYLTASHLSGETVTCFGTANCSEVLGSSYAKIGPAPLAAFGVAAYLVAFIAAVLAAFGEPRARSVLMVAVAAMFLATLWLLYVQAFILHAYCSYCLLSAALTFALAGIVIVVPPPSRVDA
ncbi:MAG: vitamin K epoxide reductase family protein [Chthoniobacterales bacterium]|nr:vitamin K epoxide reductase family protein [Chthoniobacterales bacterium]